MKKVPTQESATGGGGSSRSYLEQRVRDYVMKPCERASERWTREKMATALGRQRPARQLVARWREEQSVRLLRGNWVASGSERPCDFHGQS